MRQHVAQQILAMAAAAPLMGVAAVAATAAARVAARAVVLAVLQLPPPEVGPLLPLPEVGWI